MENKRCFAVERNLKQLNRRIGHLKSWEHPSSSDFQGMTCLIQETTLKPFYLYLCDTWDWTLWKKGPRLGGQQISSSIFLSSTGWDAPAAACRALSLAVQMPAQAPGRSWFTLLRRALMEERDTSAGGNGNSGNLKNIFHPLLSITAYFSPVTTCSKVLKQHVFGMQRFIWKLGTFHKHSEDIWPTNTKNASKLFLGVSGVQWGPAARPGAQP